MADFGLDEVKNESPVAPNKGLLTGLKSRIQSEVSIPHEESDHAARSVGFESRENKKPASAAAAAGPQKRRRAAEETYPTSLRLRRSLKERLNAYCRKHAYKPGCDLSYPEAIERMLDESEGSLK